ncbi:hypothetical protein J6TS7_32200 [Paenibacillus dendritiformis]|uniref:hypothetical protein n=1 Tax=Paenibacillus TaxID=44249 RepID=UPI001B2BC485|nr:hypothetical protein [Paenibacillus dendritiformis]GIO79610.1 hypothetical protein J6TS7_32200 [Paenibacillus dendritiformis]
MAPRNERKVYKPGDVIPIRLRLSDQNLADYINSSPQAANTTILEAIALAASISSMEAGTHSIKADQLLLLQEMERLMSDMSKKLENKIEHSIQQKVESLKEVVKGNMQSGAGTSLMSEKVTDESTSGQSHVQPESNNEAEAAEVNDAILSLGDW